MSTPLRRALYGRLAGDTTLTGLLAAPRAPFSQSIYYQQVPPEAPYPLVVFAKQSGVPTDTFQTPGAFDSDVWLVKGIDRSDTVDTVEAIQARLVALLNDAPLSISGRRLMMLRRQSDVDYPETVANVTFRHAGSLFRLIHQP